MKSSLTVNDDKWRKIKAMIPEIAKASVKVGIQSDAGEQDGVSIAQYAFYNEFGTNNIPERSFLRTSMDENQAKYNRFIDNRFGKALTLELTARQALDQLGLMAVSDVQKKITDIRTPPNAESTVRIKGSSNPLIDNGTMRRAVRHEVENV